jgi:hypothetical protein
VKAYTVVSTRKKRTREWGVKTTHGPKRSKALFLYCGETMEGIGVGREPRPHVVLRGKAGIEPTYVDRPRRSFARPLNHAATELVALAKGLR